MFEIAAPPDEVRSEPALSVGGRAPPDEARFEPLLAAPPPSPSPSQQRREAAGPDLRLSVPPPSPLDPPGRERPVEVRRRTRPFGSIVSLVLHLSLLALILDWPMPTPPVIEPIPVQLVVEPPPPPPAPPPPAPKPLPPPPKPAAPPPRGRIASEDLGDTEAKATEEPKGDAPAATEAAPAPAPPEPAAGEPPPQQTAALVPPPPVAPEKPAAPKEEHAVKPPPKPKPAAHQPPRRTEEHGHLAPRPARYPGPAATRDEYLAYLAWLVRQHIGILPLAMVGGRRGETVVDILVLGDGTIAMLRVGRSSGHPDIDLRIEQMISAVGRFPPLPQWYQGPSMQLEFRLRYPEALED